MPGVGAYFVLPALSAAMHASLMCSGVSKSGSPAAKPQTSSPCACRALALASTASVGEGETLRAQVDSGAGRLLMDKRVDQSVAVREKQARLFSVTSVKERCSSRTIQQLPANHAKGREQEWRKMISHQTANVIWLGRIRFLL